jgi:hypothetical protein
MGWTKGRELRLCAEKGRTAAARESPRPPRNRYASPAEARWISPDHGVLIYGHLPST